MPRRKDISNDFREAVVHHQSWKGYKDISKLFADHYCTVRKIIHKSKTFKAVGNPPRRHCKKPKSYISDSTGLS